MNRTHALRVAFSKKAEGQAGRAFTAMFVHRSGAGIDPVSFQHVIKTMLLDAYDEGLRDAKEADGKHRP